MSFETFTKQMFADHRNHKMIYNIKRQFVVNSVVFVIKNYNNYGICCHLVEVWVMSTHLSNISIQHLYTYTNNYMMPNL